MRPLAVARCDIDRFLASGFFPLRGPFALGHECVGEIAALGDGVRGLAVGQRVVVSFQVSCGRCAACAAGRTANCERMPTLSDYGMQPLSGVEYGGMLSDLVRVPHAEAMLQPVSAGARSRRARERRPTTCSTAIAPWRRICAALPGSEVLIVEPRSRRASRSTPRRPRSRSARAASTSRAPTPSSSRSPSGSARIRSRPTSGEAGAPLSDRRRRGRLARGPRLRDPRDRARGHLPERELLSRRRRRRCRSAGMYTLGIRFFIGRCHAAALLPEVVAADRARRLRPEAVTTRVVDWSDAADAWLEPAIKLVVRRSRLIPSRRGRDAAHPPPASALQQEDPRARAADLPARRRFARAGERARAPARRRGVVLQARACSCS